jgi:hypothetical protein
VGAWLGRGEARSVQLRVDSVWQREADLGIVELLHCCSAALVGGNGLHAHDLDGVGSGSMPRSHVTV